MDQDNKVAAVLVEFDSLKGPVIRKKTAGYEFPNDFELENILMWIIRSNEFSVRKVDTDTAYAKTIELRDPNFSRKKRQFGLALITKDTIDLQQAEDLLNTLVKQCHEIGENEPYFKMLFGLLQVLGNVNDLTKNLDVRITNDKISTSTSKGNGSEVKKQKESNQFLLMSNRLKMLNKISLKDRTTKLKTIICSAENFGRVKETIGEIYEIASKRYTIQVDVRYEVSNALVQGLEILVRILEVIPIDIDLTTRIIPAVEFLDRLVYEEVDIEYYLPFLQYFISMENYTITEFMNEGFRSHLPNLKETHGEWVEALVDKNFDGKNLTEFFKITGVRREGLELLIDLLFIKLLAIF